jgi:hypothetical protein
VGVAFRHFNRRFLCALHGIVAQRPFAAPFVEVHHAHLDGMAAVQRRAAKNPSSMHEMHRILADAWSKRPYI